MTLIAKKVEQWLSEQDAYTQTSENSVQGMMHYRGRPEPAIVAVAVEPEEIQRRNHLSVDGDRRIFQACPMRSAKEH